MANVTGQLIVGVRIVHPNEVFDRIEGSSPRYDLDNADCHDCHDCHDDQADCRLEDRAINSGRRHTVTGSPLGTRS